MADKGTSGLFSAEAWLGGSYELAIEIGDRSDYRLSAAETALWRHTALDGCYLDGTHSPSLQNRVAPGKFVAERLLGVGTLPNQKKVACSSFVVREDGGSDWIYFGIPMGSLGTAHDIGAFPYDDDTSLDWRGEIDSWLCSIANGIFSEVPFKLGVVGWLQGEIVNSRMVDEQGIPEVRYVGYLRPAATGLDWFPPTGKAPMKLD